MLTIIEQLEQVRELRQKRKKRKIPVEVEKLPEDTAKCFKCREIKKRSEFHTKKANKTGLDSSCKKCRALAWAAYGAERGVTNKTQR
jgi:hypothetical protein